MKSKSLDWKNKKDIKKLAQSLQTENISLGSSDTVIGLLAPLTLKGYKQLNTIKNRLEKPYLILINSMQRVPLFSTVQLHEGLKRLMLSCWPGPLTLILNAKPTIPFYLKSFSGTVALRVPDHQGLRTLLGYFPGLFSTSANKAGQPIPKIFNEIEASILQDVEYSINQEHKADMLPSTILDCTGIDIKVVREGAYAIKDLEKIYGQSFIR